MSLNTATVWYSHEKYTKARDSVNWSITYTQTDMISQPGTSPDLVPQNNPLSSYWDVSVQKVTV